MNEQPNLVQKSESVTPSGMTFTATEATIDDAIKDAVYQRIGDTTVTVCVLNLKNGFSVVGHSACVDPRRFDYEIGRRIARENAYQKCWEFLGFALSSKLNGGEFLFKAEKIDG